MMWILEDEPLSSGWRHTQEYMSSESWSKYAIEI